MDPTNLLDNDDDDDDDGGLPEFRDPDEVEAKLARMARATTTATSSGLRKRRNCLRRDCACLINHWPKKIYLSIYRSSCIYIAAHCTDYNYFKNIQEQKLND